MKNKKNKDELLVIFENSLKSYKDQLINKPNSTFYQGLVKNTESLIEEFIKNKKV